VKAIAYEGVAVLWYANSGSPVDPVGTHDK